MRRKSVPEYRLSIGNETTKQITLRTEDLKRGTELLVCYEMDGYVIISGLEGTKFGYNYTEYRALNSFFGKCIIRFGRNSCENIDGPRRHVLDSENWRGIASK